MAPGRSLTNFETHFWTGFQGFMNLVRLGAFVLNCVGLYIWSFIFQLAGGNHYNHNPQRSNQQQYEMYALWVVMFQGNFWLQVLF